MESSSLSLVSRAKTALHSAAAKVLTDIKAKADRESDGSSSSHKGSRSSVEQESGGGADDSTKPPQEVSERESSGEKVGSSIFGKISVPPASVIKQLAVAIESGKNFKSMNDLFTFDGDPSLIKEKTGLSFSVVKSLVIREKEDKSSTELSVDEEVQTLISSLFDSDSRGGPFYPKENWICSASVPVTNLPKDIFAAPPGSFVARLSEIIGRFKSLQKMASFWHSVVIELRRLWSDGKPIPSMPLDASPDLNSCLLHQQLQVINCCIARKCRRSIAIESLDSILKQARLESNCSVDSRENLSSDQLFYARINSGEYVLRLGADHLSANLTMLETGEPIYSPVMQEGPVLTEELIKENEEFVLRTGSVGAGCSQLLSDMQAFKAANPGCILEDFIRWHSPPDWTEVELVSDLADGEGSSRRGRLSRRMQKEGNLWCELWESSKPLPAVKQAPLFDEDLAVESILTTLEDITPTEFFEQLFISVLCSGLVIAEAALPSDSNLSKVFFECKDYIIATYQVGLSNENIGDICRVYETIETLALHPEEAIMVMEHPEEASEQPQSRFRRIGLNFTSKDRVRRKPQKDEKKLDDKHGFSRIFDKKPSLFSRKPPKSNVLPTSEPNPLDETDWTLV